MSQSVRRWLLPLVAAGAVLGIIAVVWVQRPGAGGGIGVAAGGGDAGSQGGGSPPYVGSAPASPGPDSAPPDGDVTTEPAVSAPRHLIGVDSYYRYDARRLALNFSNGVPECYGTAGAPKVEETPDAVVLTIPRIPPPPGKDDVACIEIAVLLSVDITLDEPLGDRAVLDGSRDRTPVPEAEAAYADGPTY